MISLNDVRNVPQEDTIERRLLRCRLQQAMLANMAHDAAEKAYPGFADLAERVVMEEDELLRMMGQL
jgi:hypothetical protein